MSESRDKPRPTSREKVLGGLDRMVEHGRVTEAEAARLRAATDDEGFEAGMRAIRARHAGAKLDAAVEAGQMTRGEADANLERLRNGEHPGALREQLRGIHPRGR